MTLKTDAAQGLTIALGEWIHLEDLHALIQALMSTSPVKTVHCPRAQRSNLASRTNDAAGSRASLHSYVRGMDLVLTTFSGLPSLRSREATPKSGESTRDGRDVVMITEYSVR